MSNQTGAGTLVRVIIIITTIIIVIVVEMWPCRDVLVGKTVNPPSQLFGTAPLSAVEEEGAEEEEEEEEGGDEQRVDLHSCLLEALLQPRWFTQIGSEAPLWSQATTESSLSGKMIQSVIKHGSPSCFVPTNIS